MLVTKHFETGSENKNRSGKKIKTLMENARNHKQASAKPNSGRMKEVRGSQKSQKAKLKAGDAAGVACDAEEAGSQSHDKHQTKNIKTWLSNDISNHQLGETSGPLVYEPLL